MEWLLLLLKKEKKGISAQRLVCVGSLFNCSLSVLWDHY